MAIIDELQIIDGYFEDNRFIIRGIAGHAVYGRYKAEGLRSMAELVQGPDPLTLVIDKNRKIQVPVEMNERLKKELNLIADELDKGDF